MFSKDLIKYLTEMDKDIQINILLESIDDTLAVCEHYNINDDEFIDTIFFKYLSHKVYNIWRRSITPHISYALVELEHIVTYYTQKYDYMFEHQMQDDDIVKFIRFLE